MKQLRCLLPFVAMPLSTQTSYSTNDEIQNITISACRRSNSIFTTNKFGKDLHKVADCRLMKMQYFLTALMVILSCQARAQRVNGLIPDFTTVQYSGSIGSLSAGVGYDVLKRKARLSAHYGIVPRFQGASLNVISAKLFFRPTTLTIWNRVRMNSVDIGLISSFHFGDDLRKQFPEGVYPKGYYWWRPAFRVHPGMESSIT